MIACWQGRAYSDIMSSPRSIDTRILNSNEHIPGKEEFTIPQEEEEGNSTFLLLNVLWTERSIGFLIP
jgi:hypothetical protein